MKKLISLLCVITLLLSSSAVVSACTLYGTNDLRQSTIKKVAYISKLEYNDGTCRISNENYARSVALIELDLTNALTNAFSGKTPEHLKYGAVYMYYYINKSGTYNMGLYEVNDFDWSKYDENTTNYIEYIDEASLPFDKSTDLITEFNAVSGSNTVDVTEWLERKISEGKSTLTVAVDFTDSTTGQYFTFRGPDFSSNSGRCSGHPYLIHRTFNYSTDRDLKVANINTVLSDVYCFNDEDGTNYVFCKYALADYNIQEVTDLGITVGDTFYSLKKDGDTTEFNKALSSKCFGIGIKDTSKKLGNTYEAIPQVVLKHPVSEDTTPTKYTDNGFVKSGEGITVNQ